MYRGCKQHLALEKRQSSKRRPAQSVRLLENRVEYRSEIAGRRVDDLQNLGDRGLLLQGFACLGQQPQSYALKPGMVVIVPQGVWHRFEAPDGVSLMTTTPQPTQHLNFAIEDPRTLE